MSATTYDWRKEYVLCEHIARADAETADKDSKHSGFRVCCFDCWTRGYLRRDDLTPEADINGYAVRSLPPEQHEQAVRP